MSSLEKKPGMKKIQNSDPGRIMNLVIDLTDEDCSQLQIKINVYLRDECDADLVVPVILNEDTKEASICTVGHITLPRVLKICIPERFMDCLRKTLPINELLSEFDEDFKHVVEPHLPQDNEKKRVLVVPIIDKPFSILICLFAPKATEESSEVLVKECFLCCWPTLKKSILFEHERSVKDKCQQLLRAARRLVTQETGPIEILLKSIIEQAKCLTHAEFCTLFLVDVEAKELVERYPYEDDPNSVIQKKIVRRCSLATGIVGQAARSGDVLNITSGTEHPAFDPTVDGRPGCKALLCFPIRERSGIIGVAQLINKVGERHFNPTDEELALAFSIFCGLCIVHSVTGQKIREAYIRKVLASEVVMYHMKVSDTEVDAVLNCDCFHDHPELYSLGLNQRELPQREYACLIYRMFTNVGFDQIFNIHPRKLVRFILQVKKGYRDVPYHNWMHAFSVTQYAFACIKNYDLIELGYLTELQALMYAVACLVHDMDHRGAIGFHMQGRPNLAALFTSEGSVVERHHLAQALEVLNIEGCEILDSLPRHDYDRALLMLRDYVLATDLVNFYKNLCEYRAIAMDYQMGNPRHGAALAVVLMTATDLSDHVKDWNCAKKTAASVLMEFFHQNELEKRCGAPSPYAADRGRAVIPDLQIDFIHNVCVPVFELLSKIIPRASVCLSSFEHHIFRWENSKSIFAEVPTLEGISVLLSPELDNLIDFNIQEKERLRLLAIQEAEEAERAAREAALAAEEEEQEY